MVMNTNHFQLDVRKHICRIRKLDDSTTGENAQEVADAIRDIVQDHAGVFRTTALLRRRCKRNSCD